MSKKFSYEESLTELEKIINAMQNQQVGLDELSDMILKARKLYGQCMEKLKSVENEIAKIENNEAQNNLEE